jgi:heme a synthase
MSASPPRVERYQPWLERFCFLSVMFTGLVLFAGSSTTSNQAGMAFQSWPLSNGSLNPPGWLQNYPMFLEHSHRLLAGLTATLTIIAMVWVQLTEARRWVRRVSVALVIVILIQALLGGARVLLDKTNIHVSTNIIAQTFAVCHAAMAEVTLCLWVTLAVSESRGWMVRRVGAQPVAPAVRRWAHAATALLFLQIVVGAIMRHGGYAFAIPTFPWAGPDHALLPASWNWGVVVNFAHRVGALLAATALTVLAWNVFRDASARRQLGSWMGLVLVVVAVQIFLGGQVIWTNKNPNAATAHMLTGAFLLASTWLLTFIAYRSAWWPPAAVDHAVPS